MSGINVPQYKIFKIGTSKLKYSKWDLHITEEEAFQCNEIVRLFQGQEFRLIADIIGIDIKTIGLEDFMPYICSIVIDDISHFTRATSKKGIKINDIIYKRFVGTSGGLKKNTLLFVNAEILDELNKRCDCGRNTQIPIIPAKLETYKALTCSASQPICDPKGILVVSDCIVNIKDNVIELDDSDESLLEPKRTFGIKELENNASDGFNLCTIDYMKRVSKSLELDFITSGVCLRNAWLKGMLYPFPIIEFIEKYNNGNYMVKDVWGNYQDIRNIEMILTESSLKCWNMYESIDDYIQKYHDNGYEFAVTKICPEKLEDYRELNYQYLQSYEFSNEDIEELCRPTVDYLKDALCGDYKSTMKFLGIVGGAENGTWQKALTVNPEMLKDPFIIDSVHKMIKKKIDDAKIGKLIVHGNYQIASGDPFALMQHICGLEITGLLNHDECYSSYWFDEDDADEIVVFRSPMTSHNNIRKCRNIDNNDTRYWYQYMNNIFIVNCHDTICQALNGMDFDSDLVFSTNNTILTNRYIKLPAIVCVQRKVDKIIPTELDILKSNLGGMGNKVGSITNKVTGMLEVLSHFDKYSKEYEEIMYRIECGQLYQQNEIDKIKGIKAKEMPTYWYNYAACKGDEFQRSICSYKKPYFMTYVYSDYRNEYKKYINDCNKKFYKLFHKTLDEVRENPESEEEKNELEYFNKRMNFGIGHCSMNKICWHIENEFKDIVINLKNNSDFDYKNILYNDVEFSDKLIEQILEIDKMYRFLISDLKRNRNKTNSDKYEDKLNRKNEIKSEIKSMVFQLNSDKKSIFNTIIVLYYKEKINRQFCWDTIGNLFVNRLEELNESNI